MLMLILMLEAAETTNTCSLLEFIQLERVGNGGSRRVSEMFSLIQHGSSVNHLTQN